MGCGACCARPSCGPTASCAATFLAAYFDGYSTAYGLPQVYSSNRSYGYFPPPPDVA
jgi:hypothetical protein